MAPVILTDLSCSLNVGSAAKLDGRERNSTVCIRFLKLRGQQPTQGKNASSELQKGCLQLALEIQKICWPEPRKLVTSDLEIALFTSKDGRMEGRILLRSRASRTPQEMEEDTQVGILMAFMLGNSVPRGPGVDLHVPAFVKDRDHVMCTYGGHGQTFAVQLNETGSPLWPPT
jgi:hypothetical protein